MLRIGREEPFACITYEDGLKSSRQSFRIFRRYGYYWSLHLDGDCACSGRSDPTPANVLPAADSVLGLQSAGARARDQSQLIDLRKPQARVHVRVVHYDNSADHRAFRGIGKRPEQNAESCPVTAYRLGLRYSPRPVN